MPPELSHLQSDSSQLLLHSGEKIVTCAKLVKKIFFQHQKVFKKTLFYSSFNLLLEISFCKPSALPCMPIHTSVYLPVYIINRMRALELIQRFSHELLKEKVSLTCHFGLQGSLIGRQYIILVSDIGNITRKSKTPVRM